MLFVNYLCILYICYFNIVEIGLFLQTILNYKLLMVAVTTWLYNLISSKATYTGWVVTTSSRAGGVFHVGITRERINYFAHSDLLLGTSGAWMAAGNAIVGGETEAKVRVVTPTSRVGDTTIGSGAAEKGKGLMLEVEDIAGPFMSVEDWGFLD